MIRYAIAIVALWFLGCASSLKAPDPAKVVKGVTTYDEVIARYGQPTRELRHSDGTRVLQYSSLKRVQSVTGDRSDAGGFYFRLLSMLVSPQGKVMNYAYHENTQPVYWRQEFLETGRPITEDKLRQIRKGATTRGDLIQLLGRPFSEGLHFWNGPSLIWRHGRHRHGATQNHQVLEVLLDQGEVVLDYQTRQASDFAPYRLTAE